MINSTVVPFCAAARLGTGYGEFPAPVGGLHDGPVGPGKPAPLITGAEPGAGHRAARGVEPAAQDDLGAPFRSARHIGDEVVELFGSRVDPQPDLVVIKAFHGASLVVGPIRQA
jgi:hypothetical protein